MLSQTYGSAVERLKLAAGLGPNREKCGNQNFNNVLKEAKVLPTIPCSDPGPSSLGTSPITAHKTSPLPTTTNLEGRL